MIDHSITGVCGTIGESQIGQARMSKPSLYLGLPVISGDYGANEALGIVI